MNARADNSIAHRVEALSNDRAKILKALVDSRTKQARTIQRYPRQRNTIALRAPASWTQWRFWLLEQVEGSAAGHVIVVKMMLRGSLDGEALGRALDTLMQRHEVLRTTFVEESGELFQLIHTTMQFPLAFYDLCSLTPESRNQASILSATRERAQAFDLANGPLIRARLVRTGEEEYSLLIAVHHIVFDTASMQIFVREFAHMYAADSGNEEPALEDLPIQYADYSRWQRETLRGAAFEEQSRYWQEHLKGAAPEIALPTDRGRPAVLSGQSDSATLNLSGPLTTRIKAFASERGATPFMVLCAAWTIVLAKLSGQSDVVVGTPVAGRNRKEFAGLIGCFGNTLPIRLDARGELSVRAFLDQTVRVTLANFSRQDVPFERMVETLRPVRLLNRHPVFQVTFTLVHAGKNEIASSALDIAVEDLDGSSGVMDLAIIMQESSSGIVGRIDFATDLFEKDSINRWCDYLRVVLEAMVRDDSTALADIQLSGDSELRERISAADGEFTDFCVPYCMHELFEEQVERTPDAVAVVYEQEELSYAELNRRANRLAHYLRGLGVGPERPVGLCLERSVEMVVGLLGILKAGGAYVPLDPGYPRERLQYMLRDSGAMALVTQGSLVQLLSDADGAAASAALVVLDGEEDRMRIGGCAADNPPRGPLTSRNLAYVIYTSGSTGQPKGVMVEHASLTNCLNSMRAEPGLAPKEALIAQTSICFDIAALELYLPLIAGGTVICASAATAGDPLRMADLVHRSAASAMQATPSGWNLMLREKAFELPPHTRILCGGEALSPDLARKLLARTDRVWNVYGPTETTIWSAMHRVRSAQESAIVGRPIANTRIYILDERMRPVPVGVAGELYIGGAGVARGYLNRPQLTAERFIDNPYVAGDRLYKTGDLGRYLSDGNIEFLGRNDFQVKIRGYRIELGEIESQLRQCAGVGEAVVLAREDGGGADKRLVAYYTVKAGEEVSAEALKEQLSRVLTGYMVPAAYVRLEELPLTANGKLDRKGLPAPDDEAYVKREYHPPQGATEQTLARIWRELLGVQQVGREDNFFELGGHSILATQMMIRIQSLFGIELPLQILFDLPSIAALSIQLDALSQLASPADTSYDGIRTATESWAPLGRDISTNSLYVEEGQI